MLETINATQSQEALQSLTRQSTPSAEELKRSEENLNKLEAAKRNAGRVLNSYPEYSKATPDFTARIVEAFAHYPEAIQTEMASTTTGLASRHPYLPTVADVISMGNELKAEAARQADMDRRYSGVRRTGFVFRPTDKLNPFPQLTAAVADEPDLLKREFDVVAEAAKKLVTEGEQLAREYLRSRKGFAR